VNTWNKEGESLEEESKAELAENMLLILSI